MRSYSPGGTLNALAAAQKGSIPPTPSVHRLRPGLPGYLIPFAPLAFAPQRQIRSSESPSPLVFFQISKHSTVTPGIPLTSTALKTGSISGNFPVKRRRFHQETDQSAYAPFTPNNSEQRSHPPCYRGCWHGVSRCFLTRYLQSGKGLLSGLIPSRQWFTIRRPSSHTRRRTI